MKFRLRAIPGIQVQARRWTGKYDSAAEIAIWAHKHGHVIPLRTDHRHLDVQTAAGAVEASPGSWLVLDAAGHLEVVKDEVFNAIYEAVPHDS